MKNNQEFMDMARKKILELQDMIDDHGMQERVVHISMFGVIDEIENDEASISSFFAFNVSNSKELEELIPYVRSAYSESERNQKNLDDLFGDLGISLN